MCKETLCDVMFSFVEQVNKNFFNQDEIICMFGDFDNHVELIYSRRLALLSAMRWSL